MPVKKVHDPWAQQDGSSPFGGNPGAPGAPDMAGGGMAGGLGTAQIGKAQGFGGQYESALGAQGEALSEYERIMMGGKTRAQQSLQDQAARGASMQAQLATQSRGGSMAATAAAAGGAGSQMQLAGQMDMLKAQEQQAAMQAYNQQAGAMAGQQLNAQLGMAGLSQQGYLGQFGSDVDQSIHDAQMQQAWDDFRRERGMGWGQAALGGIAGLFGGIGMMG